MSIAIVWSSANEDGLTASAKGAIAEGIRENGADVEEIYLNHAACTAGGRKIIQQAACGWV